MSADALAALIAFAFATLWTPGPNNILLANSGATFGFRRSIPHALGVAMGFPLMMFFIAVGLGELFRAEPALRAGLRYVGAGVMLWLAWKIASAGRARAEGGKSRPWRIYEAIAFQWINPKAWSMAIGLSSAYMTGARPIVEAAIIASIFLVIGMGSATGWTCFGAAIRGFLSTEGRLRVFNMTMGALVAASAIYILIDGA